MGISASEGSSQIKFQGKVKPKTILSMVSALRSVHVERRLSTKPFESEWLKRILAGISRCHPSDNTKKAEPMSMVTLEKVVDTGDKSTEELNFNTACKIPFADFLRSGEFCYSASDLKDKYTFINTKLTRSDITFAADDSYAILRLKRSKSDIDHQGVDIILAATNKPCCPVTALKTLFEFDPQPPFAPLLDFKEALATTIPSFQFSGIAYGRSNYLTGTNTLHTASDGAPHNTPRTTACLAMIFNDLAGGHPTPSSSISKKIFLIGMF